MRRRRLSQMLSVVSISIVQIRIEARVGEDEIVGRIESDAGPGGSFTGWLGLISLLDSLLSAGVMPTAAPVAQPDGADALGTTGEGRDK